MEIEDRFRRIFATVMGNSVDQVDEDSSPDTLSSWDSLRQMNLVSAIEEEFETTLSFDETTTLTNYASVLDLVRAKVG